MSDNKCLPDNQREMDDNTELSHDHKPHDPESCLTREEMDHPVRAAIHFNLDDPEGERRLRECLDAPRWKSAVWEFDQWMRNKIKYGSVEPAYEIIRAHLHMVFGERGIDIWED